MNYYTSDQHFGHKNIIKFCNRPYKDVEEMNQDLINKWNEVVTASDHVYSIGDFSFKDNGFLNALKQLNGTIHFVLGNHDPKGIRENLKDMNNVIVHDLIHKVKDNGRKVVLCHYPIYEWDGMWHGTVHFHGHTHGTIGDNFRRNAFDVGVDSSDYYPRTYDQIVGDKFVEFGYGE